jgi:hypothetical protein
VAKGPVGKTLLGSKGATTIELCSSPAAAAGQDLVADALWRLLVVERADARGQSPQVGLELDRPVFEDQDRLEYTRARIRAGALNRARRL